MFFSNFLKSGWLHALIVGLVAYPISSISGKIVASILESNILVYTMFFFISSSFALLLFAGPGTLSIATLKRFETWFYAILQLFTQILAIAVVIYVSATQGAGLFRLSSCMTLLISVIFLGQKTNKSEMLGFTLILAGIFIIIKFLDLPIEQKAILVVLLVLRSLSHAGGKVVAEIHKTNRKANSFKDGIRVTGFILFASSTALLALLLVVAYFKSSYDIALLDKFPTYAQLFDFNTLLLAFGVGFFVVSVSKYCEFYASKTIGAKYLTALLSLQIIFVYLMEDSLVSFGLMEPLVFSQYDILALSLILVGNFVIAFSGFIRNLIFIKKGEKQDTLANLDDNFMDDERDFKLLRLNLSNLLSLYDKDSKKLAQELKVDRITLDNIINYDFYEQKIENKLVKIINDFASSQVGNIDKLTKAYNRYYLDHKANELIENDNSFKLYYLDLNKFKPINDKYGHEAGDFVLSTVIPRLIELNEFNDCVFRVGGDEFVLLQTSNIENNLEDLILETIELPVEYSDMQLQVSTSIGRVHSDDYKTLDDMLKQADELMFEHKKSKKTSR